MRALIFIITALMMGPSLFAQKWTPWEVSAVFQKDSEGYESFRSMRGKDSTGAPWQVAWGTTGVVVTAPDGSQKTLDKAFPVEAHPHGGMSISKSDIEKWKYRDWECLRVRIDTGRNGIGMDYYLVVVVDRRTKAWAVCSGRVSGDSIQGPILDGNDLTLHWSDEEDDRPLRVKHEWKISRIPGGVRVTAPPITYQLEYGYPYGYRFWSDVVSSNPDVAEHMGWLSVAWKISGVDKVGGTADSTQTAVPRVPGKQVWHLGTGPDIWFPVVGTVKFRWEKEVEVRRFAHPVEKVAPQIAAGLAAGGEWDLIVTRDDKGKYMGAMLIERRPGI